MPDQGGEWDLCADAWAAAAPRFERSVQDVTLKLLSASRLVPGEVVLDLACGPGGMLPLLAELVQPGGRVLGGDISHEMLDAAGKMLAREGIGGVELGRLEVDWLDLESASVGALVCRFGYMFARDPEAALKEARRVIRPAGTFAAAVWDVPEANPYGRVPLEALAAVGMADVPRAGDPGMFRLSEPGLMEDLLHGAGFTQVDVEPATASFGFDSFDDLLDWITSLSMRVRAGLSDGAEGTAELFREELLERSREWTREDGSISLPGRVLVASGRG